MSSFFTPHSQARPEMRVRLDDHNLSASFALVMRDQAGNITHAGTKVEVAAVGEFEEIPTLVRIDIHKDSGSLQLLMDDLWRCGVRPTEGAGTAGHAAATERHLKSLESELSIMHLKHDETQGALIKALASMLPRP